MRPCVNLVAAAAILLGAVPHLLAQEPEAPPPAARPDADQRGMATSENGVTVGPGELLVLATFEAVFDHNHEYQPAEFGYGSPEDFEGRQRELTGLLFFALGVTPWLELELQGAYTDATLEKGPEDPTGMPARLAESGLADLEGELRLRALEEGPTWPEIFVFFNVIAPSQGDTSLIGDSEWDLKVGLGFVKAYVFGTFTFRTVFEWNREDLIIDLGESAIEYFRDVNPAWRLYAGIEGGEGGAPDEWSLNLFAQWALSNAFSLRFGTAVGITPKAADIEPNVGLLFTLPVLSSARPAE